MRLDKLLANSGFGSRKDVKKLVKGPGCHSKWRSGEAGERSC